MVRKARRGHHELLRRFFPDSLDDGDLSDLERIMGRIKVSIEAG
jgi:hypothetical protein